MIQNIRYASFVTNAVAWLAAFAASLLLWNAVMTSAEVTLLNVFLFSFLAMIVGFLAYFLTKVIITGFMMLIFMWFVKKKIRSAFSKIRE